MDTVLRTWQVHISQTVVTSLTSLRSARLCTNVPLRTTLIRRRAASSRTLATALPSLEKLQQFG